MRAPTCGPQRDRLAIGQCTSRLRRRYWARAPRSGPRYANGRHLLRDRPLRNRPVRYATCAERRNFRQSPFFGRSAGSSARGGAIVRQLYTALLTLATPLILLRLLVRARKQPGYLRNVGERFGFYGTAPTRPV